MTSRHCNQVGYLAGQKRIGSDEQCADLLLGKDGGERIDIMCVVSGQISIRTPMARAAV
jgi:hypothetical protein